ncbi:MAG TPA: hypothetical protein VHM93_03110 [Candidatus Acidoferrum sp.]|nr:hypothetical protein [Candidatus Acidoferrum sp.]
MRRVLLSAALLACPMPASGQNPSGTGSVTNSATMNSNRQTVRHKTKAAEQPPTPVDLPPDTPVVTLKGVCDTAKKSEIQDCKTVFTRGQMDRIVAHVAPGAPEAFRPQVAIKYVRMLAASKLADDRGLGNNPTVAAELEKQTQLGRMQVLAKAFYRQMEEHAENPTIAELQQYYAEHMSEFEEGEVWRLSIPKSVLSPRGGRSDPAMVKAELDGLRARAALRYDFDQLQVQAYTDLDIKQTPPTTRLTMARRSSMPSDQAEVFNLQPGEVTRVIDSYTNLVILMLVSKHTASFDSMTPEIRSGLKPALLKREIQSASENVSAEFNLQYLGMSAQPELFPLSGNALALSEARTSPRARNRTLSQRRTPEAPGRTPPELQSNP